MPRKRKHDQSLPQYKVHKNTEREEVKRLRAELYAKLKRYAEVLGPEELARRLAEDYADTTGRVERLG